MARVKVNVSKKALKIVIAVGAVILAALLSEIIVHIVNYSSYESVEAKVINVYSENHTNRTGGKTEHSSSHYAVLKYNVDGNEYTAEMQLMFSWQVSEGGTTTVRYNPKNYGEIEDTFFLYGMIIISVLLALVEIILIVSLKYAKDETKNDFEEYKKKKMRDKEKIKQLLKEEGNNS